MVMPAARHVSNCSACTQCRPLASMLTPSKLSPKSQSSRAPAVNFKVLTRGGAVRGVTVGQQNLSPGGGLGLYTTTAQGNSRMASAYSPTSASAYSPTSAGLYGSSGVRVTGSPTVGSPTVGGLYGSSGARVASSPSRYSASGTVYNSPTRSFSPGQAQMASRSYTGR